MFGFISGAASKFLVAVGGGVASALTTYYATAKWEPAVIIALTALGVYLVPNAPKSTTPPTPPVV